MKKYIISKQTNTSYMDLDRMTPMEREMVLSMIQDETQRRNEEMQKAVAKAKKKLH